MSVGLFQRIDLLQVFSDCDVQRRLLDSFAGCFKPGDTQFAAFQFMVLTSLYLECLSGSDAGTHTTARAAHVPLDIVAAVADGVPVVVAFGICGGMENIFQRPPILMRLTMLTRDKMSLLRAASLRTARETARGLNDRKQRGWVEAGILRLSASSLRPSSGESRRSFLGWANLRPWTGTFIDEDSNSI